jgi:hypothetical protein
MEQAGQRLKYLNRIINVDLDELVLAYGRSDDPAYKERLARAYEGITGESIEKRLQNMWD